MIQCSKERARRSRPFGLRFASPSRTLDDVGAFVVCPLRGHDTQIIMRFSQVSSAWIIKVLFKRMSMNYP